MITIRYFSHRLRQHLHRQLHTTTRMANKEISLEDLKELMGKKQDLILIDVRTREEVAKGQIPGSINIPLDTVEAALIMHPEDFKAKYGINKPPLDAPELVFHCQMGKRGVAATSKAHELGYINACNYTGGYKEWSEKEGK
ncbi:thiosulfate:glutathione sulfurtransferase isoform X2 [Parambassis ranga]|uniref:Thiosulfate:glutathione sulfurtransferase isoform X2 n=1 Tax=Parambassis ranga TaxID=210632 RepID=A0A6P7J9N8_9TELE|nr:thiosulfate:glutathione sulfurtransferase-like isoform X2 [Parambassis ranga]